MCRAVPAPLLCCHCLPELVLFSLGLGEFSCGLRVRDRQCHRVFAGGTRKDQARNPSRRVAAGNSLILAWLHQGRPGAASVRTAPVSPRPVRRMTDGLRPEIQIIRNSVHLSPAPSTRRKAKISSVEHSTPLTPGPRPILARQLAVCLFVAKLSRTQRLRRTRIRQHSPPDSGEGGVCEELRVPAVVQLDMRVRSRSEPAGTFLLEQQKPSPDSLRLELISRGVGRAEMRTQPTEEPSLGGE